MKAFYLLTTDSLATVSFNMAHTLPIYDIEKDLVDLLPATRRLIVQGPTGSGKSTQIPQMLLEHGLLASGQAVILQPRRMAARLLAARVAAEQSSELGETVGYQIRFDCRASPETKIKYVTEGILLRQMVVDPSLDGVQTLIFDEFHERHLYGDITLAQAVELQNTRRPDLQIIVMSATLETKILEQYLSPCTVLTCEGRMYPVQIDYTDKRVGTGGPPIWELAAEAFAREIREGCAGDVLVFMPGGFEIQQTIEAIHHCPESKGFILLPLHGELPARDQDAAVARYDHPKVVVATNVAETSLTIDGIQLVIDSGLARIPSYDPHRGINTLFIEKISQASADQRAGRAGRTAPGRCIRLWSQAEHQERPVHQLPEIKRLDLAEVVLTLKAAGVTDLRQFRWLEPPNEFSLAGAEVLLADLGALDHQNHITPLGRKMLAFPAHPRYSRMLLAAQQYRCVHQAALIAALTQGRDLLLRNTSKEVKAYREDLLGEQAPSDFWILMRAWSYAVKNDFRLDACKKLGIHAQTARQVGPLHQQFLAIAEEEGLDTQRYNVADESLQKCILIGFSDRVARRLDSGTLRCEMVHGRRGVLARESAVHHSPLLVAAEIQEIGGMDKAANTLLSLATAVNPEWLLELFSEDLQTTDRVFFDAASRRVYAEQTQQFRGLTLSVKKTDPSNPDEAARILAAEVIEGRLVLKRWDHQVEQWILRLNSLCRWCPELGLPELAEAGRVDLIVQLCHGALSYKDIKDKEVMPGVQSWLSAEQRRMLEKHAPERLELPQGRRPKVVYTTSGPPYVAMRIQELYDVAQTPRIAMNRVSIQFHILAPNTRPVQITQDLAGFWRDHYPRIKSELQRKYPKHEWR